MVKIYRLITPKSVEVQMLSRANSKRKLAQLAIGKGFKTGGNCEKAEKRQSILEELQAILDVRVNHVARMLLTLGLTRTGGQRRRDGGGHITDRKRNQ